MASLPPPDPFSQHPTPDPTPALRSSQGSSITGDAEEDYFEESLEYLEDNERPVSDETPAGNGNSGEFIYLKQSYLLYSHGMYYR